MQAVYKHGHPLMVEYTPNADVVAGQVIITAETCRIAHLDIAAGEFGSLAAEGGVYEVTCLDANGIAADMRVYWDDTANGVTQDLTSAGAPFGVSVTAGVLNGTMLVRHDPAVT